MEIVESTEIPIYVDHNENYAFSYANQYTLKFNRGTLDQFKKNPQLIFQNEFLYIKDLKQLAIKHGETLYLLPTKIIEIEKSEIKKRETVEDNIFSKIKKKIKRQN